MHRNLILSSALVSACLTGCGGGGGGPSAARLSPKDFSRSQPATQPTTAPVAIKVVALASIPATQPATQPATRPARPTVISMGSYMIVGTVIAEANGQAIYADRVLAKLDDVLAKKAQSLDPRTFRNFAASMIRQQVDADIRDELEFAAAQRFTTDEDQQIASAYTAIWRQKEITRNGGSYAVTCERYLHPADTTVGGIDFDEKVKEQYRRHLVVIYYQRRVWPRVQVSADDMRRFFDRNKSELFTEKAGVLFRAIRVSKQDSGGADKAIDKIKAIQEKAKRGENFGLLATQNNDDRAWKNNGGYVGMAEKKEGEYTLMRHKDGRIILRDKEGFGVIRNPDGVVLEKSKELLKECEPVREPQFVAKGSLKSEELEKAVFALTKPGELTGIVDGGDALYLAKLEDLRAGREQTFEEEDVQVKIRRILESDQRQALRLKEQKKLVKAAVWRIDEKMIGTAVEMAMQKYYIVQPGPTTQP